MIRLLHKLLNKNRIRTKLIAFFFLTTFLMVLTGLYTYYNAYTLMLKMNSMFVSNVYLNELYGSINKVEKSLENFLETNDYDSLKEYIKYSSELTKKAGEMTDGVAAAESGLISKDIRNMISTYLEEAEEAVHAKRGRDVYSYVAHYNEASKVFGYIDQYINRLNNEQLRENTVRYLVAAKRLDFVRLVSIYAVIGIVALNIILIIWFTYRITKPIISLSHSANEISKGNFDVEQVAVDTNDEISIMADAFNRMTSSIKIYISEIKEKAELEGRLKEQEMQNLKMKSLLKEAELQALQAQINPHFIFNTLNAGAQVAMLEGADKTCAFVENVASLLRYNLRNLDKPISLKDEIDNVNTYIYILKTRFADRIQFSQEVDESAADVKMPCMILQPLVENAFIHGISENESGGSIFLRVYRQEEYAVVIVKDNGKGIEEGKIHKLLSGAAQGEAVSERSKAGHSTGIGLNNVISRLRIYFNRDDVLDIKSEVGKGTEFIIRMPLNNV